MAPVTSLQIVDMFTLPGAGQFHWGHSLQAQKQTKTKK
jgi:hypothetical protein